MLSRHRLIISAEREREREDFFELMEAVEDIVIVGAGIAGLATALGLHRLGLRSLVLESSDTLRASGFALTVWDNAWNALDALGVGDSLREQHILLEGISFSSALSGIVTAELPLNLQGTGKRRKHEVRCVMRNLLVKALAEELPEGTIRLSSKIASIEEFGRLKVLHLSDGSTLKTKVLIGCDGINSIVAKWLQLKPPKHEGRYAARGFAVFQEGHGYKLNFAQCNGKGYRAGFLPCNEKSVYWFFTWTPDANEPEIDKDPNRVREFILRKISSGNIPEAFFEIIKNSEASSIAFSPLKYRSPFNLLWGNISKGNVCVAGDAFHPMTPDLGQGGCSALEDGIILARCLSEAFTSGRAGAGGSINGEYERVKEAMNKYVNERRWRCFQLVSIGYLVGCIQESKSAVMNFLRDHCFSGLLARQLLINSDYNCGTPKKRY